MGFLINDILLSLGWTPRRRAPSSKHDFEGRPVACSDKPLMHYSALQCILPMRLSSKGIGFTKWPIFSLHTESPKPSATSV